MTQTQLSEDSARFSIAASGTLAIQPASGEFDYVAWQSETASINLQMDISDGTNNSLPIGSGAISSVEERLGQHMNFSTNTIFTDIFNAEVQTETFQRSIMTKSEEA